MMLMVKLAFLYGESGFPGKCLHCSGKDGRGPCRWDNDYCVIGTISNVRGGPLPTRCAGHLPQRGKAFGYRTSSTNQYLPRGKNKPPYEDASPIDKALVDRTKPRGENKPLHGGSRLTSSKGAMYMPQSYDHTVTGRVIRRLRLERGMSQEILSGLAIISRSHLAEIETG